MSTLSTCVERDTVNSGSTSMKFGAGGRTCFGDIWIFRQVSHRFTSSFVNPSFQYLNGSHIMYWNMIILNPSRFKVEPHSKYWYFCIEHWDLLLLRFSDNTVLIHIEWVCLKNAGNVNLPPYHYTTWLTEHVLRCLIWGWQRGKEKRLGGSEKMHMKRIKICYVCHFCAEIVTFDVIFIRLYLFWEGKLGGKKILGVIPPCPLPLCQCHWKSTMFGSWNRFLTNTS